MAIFLWVFIITLLGYIFMVGYALLSGGDPKDWVPIAISLLAVLIALASAFKAELFPIQLVVSGLGAPKKQYHPADTHTALRLDFLNKGYGEDVVEWVGLNVK